MPNILEINVRLLFLQDQTLCVVLFPKLVGFVLSPVGEFVVLLKNFAKPQRRFERAAFVEVLAAVGRIRFPTEAELFFSLVCVDKAHAFLVGVLFDGVVG